MHAIHFLLPAALALLGEASPEAGSWPCFRGPGRQGISDSTGLPVRVDRESTVWKTEIPGEGWSSPIVQGGTVIVTTATEEGTSCRVIALERRTGKIRWDREVFRQAPGRKEGKNSYATPTPVTDGSRVWAVFGDGSIACLGLDGSPAWINREFKFHSKHGLGASPILHAGLLIMPYDGSSDGEDPKIGWKQPWEKAVIAALDAGTGAVRWKGHRGLSRIAHVTPNILRDGALEQLVSGAGDVVQGFDLATGERLWSVHSQGEGVVPSIVIGDGLVYSVSGFEQPTIRAVRPGWKGRAEGDKAAAIAWEQKKGVPSQSSLLYIAPHVFAITDTGVVTCYLASTGEIVGQERVGGNHSASPVGAEGRIYFLSESGEMTVIAASTKLEVIARSTIEERCQASLAVSEGQIFLRSARHLRCIGGNPSGRKKE